eukprot:15483328-Alexandrium_andersonii.AAC.1
MHHMGSAPSSECPFCQHEKEDWQHMWWQCEAFADVREKWWPEGVPPYELLPQGLRNAGLAPSLTLSRGGALWGRLESGHCHESFRLDDMSQHVSMQLSQVCPEWSSEGQPELRARR